jgi:hypothetical protein
VIGRLMTDVNLKTDFCQVRGMIRLQASIGDEM